MEVEDEAGASYYICTIQIKYKMIVGTKSYIRFKHICTIQIKYKIGNPGTGKSAIIIFVLSK